MDFMDLRALIRKSRADHPKGLSRLQEIENLQGHTSVHSSLAGVAQNGEKSKEAVQPCEENPRPCYYKYLKAGMQDSEFDSRKTQMIALGKFIKGGQSARSTEGSLCPHS
jgi:hypothetical protein